MCTLTSFIFICTMQFHSQSNAFSMEPAIVISVRDEANGYGNYTAQQQPVIDA